MKELTPELEAILCKLAELCCEGVRGGETVDQDRIKRLVGLLYRNGWDRSNTAGPPLSVYLRHRAQIHCRNDAMHHREQLQAVTERIEKAYREAAREASMPEPRWPPA